MKLTFFAAGSALLLSTAFFSCKKSTSESRSAMLVGTWNVNAYGIDDNMNGTLETSEYDTIPAGAALVQTYRSDGTGMITTQAAGQTPAYTNMTWKLTDGDKNLQITVNGTTTNATITKLTANELQGYDPGNAPRVIYLLTK